MMIDTTISTSCAAEDVYADSCVNKQIVYLTAIDRPKLAPKGATHMADGQYYKLSGHRVFIWRDGWVNKRLNYRIGKLNGKAICSSPQDDKRPGNARWSAEEYAMLKESMRANIDNYTLKEAVRIAAEMNRSAISILRQVRKIAKNENLDVIIERGAFYQAIWV